MKAAKKAFSILSVFCLIFCMSLTACSSKDSSGADSAKEAAKISMKSLETLDLKTFNRYTDNYVKTYRNWIGIPTSREYRIFNELLQPVIIKGEKYRSKYNGNEKLYKKALENMTWTIKDVQEQGDTADIKIEITNSDLSDVMGLYMIHVMEDMINSQGTGLKQMLQNLDNLDYDKGSILPYMESEKTITSTVTVPASRKDGKWKLHVSDSFINAFMGNFDSGEYSDEVQERLEELEEEYDKKIEDWADGFSDDIGDLSDKLFDYIFP